MNPVTPTADGCRARQSALTAAMQELQVDLVILTRGESVNWLTGVFLGPLFAPTAAIDADGRVMLSLPERKLDTPAVADELVGYEAKWHSTMRNNQRQASIAALVDLLGTGNSRLGGEFSEFPRHFDPDGRCAWTDIEPTLFRLRRHKHDDELAMLARANEANDMMFQCARELIEPGVSELDLYNALQTAAVDVLEEPLTYFGQDFRCAARGGSPRGREAQGGELYIIDLGVGYRGYYSDNARHDFGRW